MGTSANTADEYSASSRAPDAGGSGAGGSNHEEWDYYYFNIQENAAERIRAFLGL